MPKPASWSAALAVVLSVSACVIIKGTSVEEVSPHQPQTVDASVRAFLTDGSMVLFPDGAVVSDSEVTGAGHRFDLHRDPLGATQAIPLDSVLGLEAYDEWTDPGMTLLASIGATAVTIATSVALICAADPKCFGSCPTVYSGTGEGEILEAEAFSYSISPLLEARDLDRLVGPDGSSGEVRLEIRNEALETHFINELALVEVRHGKEETVLPDHQNMPVTVGPLQAFTDVRDRDGRNVTADVSTRDDQVFRTTHARIESVTAGDQRDWIEASLPPMEADSAAVVLRLRNSLLNTVLFYEFMLGQQGAGALDWMGVEIERIGEAVALGTWFYETMGLRLQVERDGVWEEVARMGDTGPIAWKDVALVVPTVPGRPTRIRLTFLADEWRIDRMAWSPSVGRPEQIVHHAHAVEPLVGTLEEDLLERLQAPDDRYVVTGAGTGFEIRFAVEPVPPEARTFLLASQGYYSEWVRPVWIRSANQRRRFEPRDEVVPALMARWLEVMGPMEEAFHATRIPVR